MLAMSRYAPHRYRWSGLSNFQVGKYAEYFVKMELTMYGFEVFAPEVDDRGVDFIARYRRGRWIEVQSKSKREAGYVFMTKDKFLPSSILYASVAVFTEGRLPDLYLIPSTAWQTPDRLLVDRAHYDVPEWGINISKRNKSLLERFRFDEVVATLLHEKT
jgi:hypothetical protein